jgi:hypothetical protein
MVNVFYLCNLEMIWDKQQEPHLLEAPLGETTRMGILVHW